MTERGFRKIACGFPGAEEREHMGHPDFRANGRIFATLHGDGATGMVKLTPDQQARVVRDQPDAFSPENGAWGRQGCTRVTLAAVDEEILGDAMTLAWQNVAARLKSRAPAPKKRRRRSS